MKKIYIVVAVVLSILPLVGLAAVQIRTGEDVSLAQEAITDDTYVVGGTVNSVASIQGDLIAAGGNLFISGSTTQDVIVAGGSVNIVGRVGDDLRAAGGNLTISGPVTDDVVVAGGQVTILPNTSIGGDVLAAGGRVVLGGVVQGSVKVSGGEVVINGTVNGNVEATAEKVTVGEQAVIRGKLLYTSPVEADIKQGSQIVGGATFTQATVQRASAADTAVSLLVKLLMYFVSALIIQLVLRNIATRLIGESSQKIWSNLGIGLVVLIVTPIACIIAMITVIGIPLSILALLFYIIDMVFVWLFLPVFLGAIAWKYFKKQDTIVLTWKTALLGAGIAVVLGFIPIVGWIACFLVFLTVLGGLVRLKKDYFLRLRNNNV
jgi:cytoskeletal protein CcmA (bactofilin family)